MRNKIAIFIAGLVAIVVGTGLLVYMTSLATWGGPNDNTVDISDLPVGLVSIVVLVVVAVAAAVAKIVYSLFTRR